MMKTEQIFFVTIPFVERGDAVKNYVVNMETVIDYIETHLAGKIDLEQIAEAVSYSKYHLHRMFTATLGMTVHDYVQRRQLTEAAKLLVFSKKSTALRPLSVDVAAHNHEWSYQASQ